MNDLPPTLEIQQLRAEADALRAELEETNQGVLALYAELDQQAEQLREVSDLQEPVPVVHEPRVPHPAGLDPEHDPPA